MLHRSELLTLRRDGRPDRLVSIGLPDLIVRPLAHDQAALYIITMHQDDIVCDLVEEFDLFDDWEDRYAHLIALGKALPDLPNSERVDAHKVSGCASQVWLVVDAAADAPDRITLRADSDAHIVKGLAAILHRLYDGRSFAEAAAFDPLPVFEKIGLSDHLTAQRANGLRAMIDRITHRASHASAGSL